MYETYWKEPINSFDLDPGHCLSTLGFSLDTMLRFLDVNFKLVTDIEKYQFLKSIIKSGFSEICEREEQNS